MGEWHDSNWIEIPRITVKAAHEFIDEQGGIKTGKHHEIYLSDMRKAVPEKWRTIIRQPFAFN